MTCLAKRIVEFLGSLEKLGRFVEPSLEMHKGQRNNNHNHDHQHNIAKTDYVSVLMLQYDAHREKTCSLPVFSSLRHFQNA